MPTVSLVPMVLLVCDFNMTTEDVPSTDEVERRVYFEIENKQQGMIVPVEENEVTRPLN